MNIQFKSLICNKDEFDKLDTYIDKLPSYKKLLSLTVVDKDGYTALMYASLKGNIETVKDIIMWDNDINIKNVFGNTALIIAVHYNKFDVVKYLIEECDADINIKNKGDNTALDLAMVGMKKEMIDYLILMGGKTGEELIGYKI